MAADEPPLVAVFDMLVERLGRLEAEVGATRAQARHEAEHAPAGSQISNFVFNDVNDGPALMLTKVYDGPADRAGHYYIKYPEFSCCPTTMWDTKHTSGAWDRELEAAWGSDVVQQAREAAAAFGDAWMEGDGDDRPFYEAVVRRLPSGEWCSCLDAAMLSSVVRGRVPGVLGFGRAACVFEVTNGSPLSATASIMREAWRALKQAGLLTEYQDFPTTVAVDRLLWHRDLATAVLLGNQERFERAWKALGPKTQARWFQGKLSVGDSDPPSMNAVANAMDL